MDNRTDVSEDLQSTPEHPAGQVPGAPGGQPLDPQTAQQVSGESGLTAGPHNDPPASPGIEDNYQQSGPLMGEPPPLQRSEESAGAGGASSAANADTASRLKAFGQTMTRNPLLCVLSAVGLTLLLLNLRKRHLR